MLAPVLFGPGFLSPIFGGRPKLGSLVALTCGVEETSGVTLAETVGLGRFCGVVEAVGGGKTPPLRNEIAPAKNANAIKRNTTHLFISGGSGRGFDLLAFKGMVSAERTALYEF